MAGREKKKNPENEDTPKKFKCWFCDGDHPLHLCSVVKSIAERKERLEALHRCSLCLDKGHMIADCYKTKFWKCQNCNMVGDHCTALCPLFENKTTKGFFAVKSTALRTGRGNLEEKCHPESRLRKNVMLLTAEVPIGNSNPDGSKPILAKVFLDNGNQRSYVSANFARKLKLAPQFNESLSVQIFLDGSHNLDFSVVSFNINLKCGEPIEIHANVI